MWSLPPTRAAQSCSARFTVSSRTVLSGSDVSITLVVDTRQVACVEVSYVIYLSLDRFGIFLIISFGYYPSLSSPRTVGGHNGTPGAVPPPVGAVHGSCLSPH